jgi:hypothetical protein
MNCFAPTVALIIILTTALGVQAFAESDADFPAFSFQCESEPIDFCLIHLSKILGQATPAYRIVLEEYASPHRLTVSAGDAGEDETESPWGIYQPISLSFTDEPLGAILDFIVAVDGYFEWIYDETSRTVFVVDKFLLASSAWIMNATVPSPVVLRDVTLGEALEALGTTVGVEVPRAERTDSFGVQRVELLSIEKDISFRFAVGRILQHAKPERTHLYTTLFMPRQYQRMPLTVERMSRLDWLLVPTWHPLETIQSPEDLESLDFKWE